MQNLFVMGPEVRAAFENVRKVESYRLEGRLEPRDVDVFWLRFERYFDDLYDSLTLLDGEREDALEQFGQLFGRMVAAWTIWLPWPGICASGASASAWLSC